MRQKCVNLLCSKFEVFPTGPYSIKSSCEDCLYLSCLAPVPRPGARQERYKQNKPIGQSGHSLEAVFGRTSPGQDSEPLNLKSDLK